MATIVTAPPAQSDLASSTSDIAAVQDSSARIPAHTVPAKQEVRMGREATAGEGINWMTLIVIALFHAGALAALFFFSWQRLAVTAILYILAINVGIGMCYHRLLTHRGYQVPKWLEYLMTLCATLSLEGGPVFWVATHRVHHQHSDHQGDPHTPREGKWWAHTGWMIWGNALHAQTAALSRYVPDLSRDRFHLWVSKYHWIPITASGVALFAGGWLWGGWKNALGMLLWGGFLRVTLGLHSTWLVNSATHLWGSRRFETRDDSRNSWWVALLTGGEGWHNNHHAHPVSAKHGLAWYEFDPNFWGIWLLSKVGLARKIRTAKFDKADPKPAGA